MAPLAVLLHALSLVSRFPDAMRALPPWLPGAVLLAQFPLLLLSVFFEVRGARGGDRKAGLPAWMRLRWPVRVGLGIAFAYFAMVILQAWDIQLGPVNLVPPPEWPLARRALHFGLMCLAVLLPGTIVISSLLAPPLSALARRLRRWPIPVAVALLLVLGMVLGFGAMVLLGSGRVSGAIGSARTLVEGEVALTVAVTLGVALLPTLFGLLRQPHER